MAAPLVSAEFWSFAAGTSKAVLNRLRAADRIDWTRAAVDASPVPATMGGAATGPHPRDGGRAAALHRGATAAPGTKRHLVVDRTGIPLGHGRCRDRGIDTTRGRCLAPTVPGAPVP